MNMSKTKPRKPGWFYRWMMAFLGLFDRWLHLSCKSFIQLASEKYERPLEKGEKIRQAMHRGVCSLCRVQEQRMEQLRELAVSIGEEAAVEDADEDVDKAPAVHLSPEAVDRIRQSMDAADRPHSDGE
jgi:hypothetical protein